MVVSCEMQGMFLMVQVDGLWCTATEIWIHYLDPYLLWCLISVRDSTYVPGAVHYTSPLWTQFLIFADLRQELRTKDFPDKTCKQINKQIKFSCLLKNFEYMAHYYDFSTSSFRNEEVNRLFVHKILYADTNYKHGGSSTWNQW